MMAGLEEKQVFYYKNHKPRAFLNKTQVLLSSFLEKHRLFGFSEIKERPKSFI